MSAIVHPLCCLDSFSKGIEKVASLGFWWPLFLRYTFWGTNSAPISGVGLHLQLTHINFPPSLSILDPPLLWLPPPLALESYLVAWPRLLSLRGLSPGHYPLLRPGSSTCPFTVIIGQRNAKIYPRRSPEFYFSCPLCNNSLIPSWWPGSWWPPPKWWLLFLPAGPWTQEARSTWAATEAYNLMHSCWVPWQKWLLFEVKDF